MNKNAIISAALTACITAIMTFVARYASPDPTYQLVVASVGMGVVSMLTCIRDTVEAPPASGQRAQSDSLKTDKKACGSVVVGIGWR